MSDFVGDPVESQVASFLLVISSVTPRGSVRSGL